MESTESRIEPVDSEKHTLYKACYLGDLTYIGEYIVTGGDLGSIINKINGQTPLHYCIHRTNLQHLFGEEKVSEKEFTTYDRLKCARVIIKSNPEFIHYYDYSSFTPLHLATINGDLEFIKLLIEFHVKLGLKTKKSQTVVDKNVQDIYGRTVLHLAVIYVQLEILNYLLDIPYMIEIINEPDSEGASALHYAVQMSDELIEKMIHTLITKGQALLNPSDSYGRTPLIWAATIGAESAFNLLLTLGANLMATDPHGLTAIHCAASRGHLNIIQCALNWIKLANMDDCDRIAQLVDTVDNDGCTPLFYSVTTGHVDITKALIESKANVMHTDHKDRTVCHCLARYVPLPNNKESENILRSHVDCLVKAGIEPWQPNALGATALHEACLLKNVHFIKLLSTLENFDKIIDQCDCQGHTALQMLCSTTWSTEKVGLELCQFLLNRGSDANRMTHLPNGHCVTCLDLAKLNISANKAGKLELIRLLGKAGGKSSVELKVVSSGTDSTNVESNDMSNLATDQNDKIDDNSTKEDENAVAQLSFVPSPKCIDSNPAIIRKVKTIDCAIQTSTVKKPTVRPKKLVRSSNVMESLVASTQTETIIVKKMNCVHNSTQMSQCTTVSSKRHPSTTKNSSNLQPTNQQIVVNIPLSEAQISCKPITEDAATNCCFDAHPRSPISKPIKKPKPAPKSTQNTFRSVVSSSHQLAKPYSQKYLEREFPAFIKRINLTSANCQQQRNNSATIQTFHLLNQQNMPKYTISPYLQPVVPNMQLGPKKTNNNKAKRQSATKMRTLGNRDGTSTLNSECQSEFYNLLDQLLSQKNVAQVMACQPVSSKGTKLKEKHVDKETNVSPTNRRLNNSRRRDSSAMGGELSPIGQLHESDGNTDGVHSPQSTSFSKLRNQSLKQSRFRSNTNKFK